MTEEEDIMTFLHWINLQGYYVAVCGIPVDQSTLSRLVKEFLALKQKYPWIGVKKE